MTRGDCRKCGEGMRMDDEGRCENCGRALDTSRQEEQERQAGAARPVHLPHLADALSEVPSRAHGQEGDGIDVAIALMDPAFIHSAPAPAAESQAAIRQQEIDSAIDLGNRMNAAMGECDEWGTWADMLRSLEEHGLAVTVGAPFPTTVVRLRAAEATLAAARPVLDALEAIPSATIQTWVSRHFETVLPLAKAELARRGADPAAEQCSCEKLKLRRDSDGERCPACPKKEADGG